MGIDVMIVSNAEDIASRPSRAMFEWLDDKFEDFDIRYGYVEFEEADIALLEERFSQDSVARMLLKKIATLKQRGETAPYLIELMIGW